MNKKIVINYKRLNNNIEDDDNDIPTKEYLLEKIKNHNIFKLDLLSYYFFFSFLVFECQNSSMTIHSNCTPYFI